MFVHGVHAVNMNTMGLLILPYAQQHQGASFVGFNTGFMGTSAQFGVFGAGVKYNPFWVGVDNIIVQGGLVLRAYVQRYGINIGMDGFGFFDRYAGYLAGFYAYVYYGMSAVGEAFSSQVSVAAWVGRGTQYQRFFYRPYQYNVQVGYLVSEGAGSDDCGAMIPLSAPYTALPIKY